MRPADSVHRWMRRSIRTLDAIAARRKWSICGCLLLGFLLPAAFGVVQGVPEPHVHDEFSYLLAADTFSRGRLTNPTHPMWRHFQSQHILQVPSYMSKYPPAQGAALALGQTLVGQPIVGVWLSAAAAAAALCWMLQGWTKPRWALVGTLLMILLIGIEGSWTQSYWGGMVAATGGALFWGGFRRILGKATERSAAAPWNPQSPRSRRGNQERQGDGVCGKAFTRAAPSSAIAMAVGILVLANSRPFESVMMIAPAFAIYVVSIVRTRREDLLQRGWGEVLPILAVLAAGGCWMLYYNHRVVGEAWRMPYQVHHAQYYRTPLFALQSENNPALGHPRLRKFYDSSAKRPTPRLIVERPRDLLFLQSQFFLSGVLSVTLLIMLPLLIGKPWLRLAIGAWIVMVAGMALATWAALPHYAAPITAVVYLLGVEALRRLRTFQARGSDGYRLQARYVIGLVAAVWLSWTALPWTTAAARSLLRYPPIPSPVLTRGDLVQRLGQLPGKHLVIVRHGDDLDQQWVYNSADIDGSRIVWAHDLGERQNQALLDYFRDRQVWTADAGPTETHLTRGPP